MLVLSRRVLESIKIGDDIEVTVTRIGAGCVRLGISCPKEMNVVRAELLDTETEE
jgi:carbon storage regulator